MDDGGFVFSPVDVAQLARSPHLWNDQIKNHYIHIYACVLAVVVTHNYNSI